MFSSASRASLVLAMFASACSSGDAAKSAQPADAGPVGWDAAKVQQAMQSGPDNTPVKVPRKIPVFIIYGTAYERDGQLWFGNDLYHRDDALVKAVAAGAVPSARAVQALEALKRIAEG